MFPCVSAVIGIFPCCAPSFACVLLLLVSVLLLLGIFIAGILYTTSLPAFRKRPSSLEPLLLLLLFLDVVILLAVGVTAVAGVHAVAGRSAVTGVIAVGRFYPCCN
jgi:hypothetical protein